MHVHIYIYNIHTHTYIYIHMHSDIVGLLQLRMWIEGLGFRVQGSCHCSHAAQVLSRSVLCIKSRMTRHRTQTDSSVNQCTSRLICTKPDENLFAANTHMECCHDKACVEEHPKTIQAWWFQLSSFQVHRRLPSLHIDVQIQHYLGLHQVPYEHDMQLQRDSEAYCHSSRLIRECTRICILQR